MFCPRCASEVSVTDVRCPKCTQYLGGKPEAVPAPAAKPILNEVKPAAPVQTPVAEKPAEAKPVEVKPVEAKPQTTPVSETVGKPDPVKTEAQTKFCAHCGEKISATALFCPMCGQKVAAVTPAPVVETPAPAPTAVETEITETPLAESAPVQEPVVAPAVEPIQAPADETVAVAPVAVEAVVPQKNGFSIAGFILSFLSPLFGLIFSIIGAVKSKKRMGKGKGLSIAGIIISALNMLISLVPTAFLVFQLVRMILAYTYMG